MILYFPHAEQYRNAQPKFLLQNMYRVESASDKVNRHTFHEPSHNAVILEREVFVLSMSSGNEVEGF
jgi:hypothetical protein